MSSTKEPSDQDIVRGMPSKELFKTMLTRDLSLMEAISDLVDNSIDGAINLRGRDGFKGIEVDISFEKDCFRIKDNCGGMSKEDAKKYAFRFGRPSDTKPINYSVGIFGIGMKRALFKMGKKFTVTSISEKSSFVIEIDVDEWSKVENNWDFQFKDSKDGRFSLKERGTEIVVTSLNPAVKERFGQSNFKSELKKELEMQHIIHISKGLMLKIDGYPIASNRLQLISSSKFTSAHWKKVFSAYGNTEVEIYAGIGEKNLEEGGWYIFCNNRLIQGPEQTHLSGWGEKSPLKIPEYHNQFSRFRGFVFFTSREPVHLPWNTSKTSVDIDSPLFQSVKQQMIIMMRPVIDFLNDIHNESKDYHNKKLEEKYLEDQIEKASSKNYVEAKLGARFSAPVREEIPIERGDTPIKYKRPENKVEKLKVFFKVSSPKQVGEKTFDYVYERECN